MEKTNQRSKKIKMKEKILKVLRFHLCIGLSLNASTTIKTSSITYDQKTHYAKA
jgi:hypothetical protein